MNAIESKLLKRVSDTEYYFYFRLKMPLGVPERDIVVHATVQPYSTKTGFLGISYSAAPDFIPPKPGVVRFPAYETSTKLIPLGENKVEEHMEGYVEPVERTCLLGSSTMLNVVFPTPICWVDNKTMP